MQATKADKRTVQIQQGQRVYSGLYGGRHGIVIAVHGEQSPASVGTMFGGVVNYGGSATVDVAFPTHISRGIPESIVRGVQWEIYSDVATADEILDAIATANAATAKAEQEAKDAADRRAAERVRLAAQYSHLTQGDGGKVGAANIRKELKKAFPGVKFSVTSTYNSISIRWTDGPTVKQVQEVTGKYEEGKFDSMQDMFVYDKDAVFASLFGGAKYVSESRTTTPALEAKAWAAYLGDSTGFTFSDRPGIVGVTVPADLPADWRQRYNRPEIWHHIEKAIREFPG